MLCLEGDESILLIKRAPLIDLLLLVIVFLLCYFNCPDFCLLRLSHSWSAVLPGMRIVINIPAWIVCGNGVFALGSSFFGLYIIELIGSDGSRYALCLSALHL